MFAEAEDWPYENFTRKEVACRCGCGGVPPRTFMRRLQALRTCLGFPFVITSGFRCPEYNYKITGKFDGAHVRGAADVAVHGERALKVVSYAREFGFTGIGVLQKGAHNERFIHLDDVAPFVETIPRPMIWSY